MDVEGGMAVDEAVEIEPIRKAVTVEGPVEHVFRVFTERMGEWWPVGSHSVFADDRGTRPETVVFEGRLGGRVYERMADGREADWATVTAWEPSHRLVLAWRPNPDRVAPTEVEVTFTDVGGSTRVDLVHRGWERLGEMGPRGRDSYETGWDPVLSAFAAAASA